MRKLKVTSEGGATVTHELAESLITIGRAPDNLLPLEDPSVSGRHAQLELVGEDYLLKDLDSTNGTRVNGQAIKSHTLRKGDRVRFGKVEACYECDVEGSGQPLPESLPLEARPAEVSARPADFANASPFPRRTAKNDRSRLAVYAAAGLAIVAFLGSMLALLLMQPPV